MPKPLVSILPPANAWPHTDPFELCDTLTIADAAMVYSSRHPRPTYWFGKGADNPSPINPREPAGVNQIEELIGKGATKDFGPGTVEDWQTSWSVYCTLVDGVEKGSIAPTKPVYLADRSINPVLTEIPLAALLDLARQRNDAGEIVSSLATWYAAPESDRPGPDPPSRRQRGVYNGALELWLAEKQLLLLQRMNADAIANEFRVHCEQKRPELLPVLPKRLRSMEPTIQRIIDRRVKTVQAGKSQNKGQQKPADAGKRQ
jgi:hypothetical protein